MGHFAQIRSRVLPISALLLPLLLPAVASAETGWGDANWGEMVWGGLIDRIPALPVEGIAFLTALLLGLSYWLFAARRRRSKRPPLHS
jgi:hypothetical protein